MKLLELEQYSPEWFAARLGIPTASGFDNIITATGKESTSADTYMHKLLAEWLMDKPAEDYQSEWMKRGTELEPEARAYYELTRGIDVRQIGFIASDDGLTGCSPDGIIMGDTSLLGGLEIKCPAPGTHVQYLLADELPPKYVQQVQGSMMISGAHWWDFLSYHPDMPPFLIRVKRDDKYIEVLSDALGRFIRKMLAKREQLRCFKEAA